MASVHHRGPYNFLGIDPVPPEKADVIVLPIPYDGTTSYMPGARFGPRAILEASRQVELYDCAIQHDVSKDIAIATLPELAIDLSSPEANVNHIAAAAERYGANGAFLLTLGGEHSITPGLVRPLVKKYPDLTVLQLDAHTDMRDSYEGTQWNHACAMRRCRDLGVRVVHVGTRNSSEEEQAFLDPRDVFFAPAMPIKKILSRITGKHVYLSIDVDVFDSSIMPATGTPEPGGIGWHDAVALIRALAKTKTLVGCDLTELAPIPGFVAPDFLVAKLAYTILGCRFAK